MNNSVERSQKRGNFLEKLIAGEFLEDDPNLPEIRGSLQIVYKIKNIEYQGSLASMKAALSKLKILKSLAFPTPRATESEIAEVNDLLREMSVLDYKHLGPVLKIKILIEQQINIFNFDAECFKKIDLNPLREKIQQQFDDGNFRVAQVCHQILGILGGEMEIDFTEFENWISEYFYECHRNLKGWKKTSDAENYNETVDTAEEIKAGLELCHSSKNNFDRSDEPSEYYSGIDLEQLQQHCDSKSWCVHIAILQILSALDAKKAPNLDLTNFTEMAEQRRMGIFPSFKDAALILKNFGIKFTCRRLSPDKRAFFCAENLGIQKEGNSLIEQLKNLKELEYEIPNFINNDYFDFLQSALEAEKYNIFWEGMQVVDLLQKRVGQKYQKTFAPHLNKFLAFILSGNGSDYYLANYPEVFLRLAEMMKAHAPETANFIKEILFIGNSEKTQKALQVVEAKLHKSLGKKILTKLVNLFGGRAAEVSEK